MKTLKPGDPIKFLVLGTERRGVLIEPIKGKRAEIDVGGNVLKISASAITKA